MQDRDVRGRHVRQVLQQPEREDRLGPRQRELARCRTRRRCRSPCAIGPTSSPTSIGVIPVPMQTPNRDGSSSVGLEARRPRPPAPPPPPRSRTARLISLAFFLCSPRKGMTSKFLTSPAILIAWPGRVEALDEADAGPPLDDRLAERATTDPVGRNHPDSGDHHAVHVIPHPQRSPHPRCRG